MRLNVELTYKELCQELSAPYYGKGAGSKVRKQQMKNWAMKYDITKTENGKYIIAQVYTPKEQSLLQALNAPHQQLLFDIAIYHAILQQGGSPLYLSNTDILILFKEVNPNFPFALNRELMNSLGEEYSYMPDMGMAVYKILKQWTMRRIDNMNYRKVVIKRDGFRLYRQYKDYKIMTNVPMESALEKRCQKVWSQAYDNILGGGIGELGGIKWLPEGQWKRFEREVQRLTMIEFRDERFTDMRLITILSPAQNEWIKDRMIRATKAIELMELEEIQSKAQDKVRETNALNAKYVNGEKTPGFTIEEKETFIDINMNPNPPFWFKDKLINK